jgi:alkanesulfonate monooxygenase SsuD/methylene tetrahydromethanopterin reductase-like flavin-dependent oxidoreductase (luciferase family)
MQFALDVSTVGTYGDPSLLSELAVLAEQAGWDGFFVWDTLLSATARP